MTGADELIWLQEFARTDWTTVLVALATGLSATLGPVLMRFLDERKERAGVRAALIAEVVALAEVIRSRGYCEDLERIERRLRRPAVAGASVNAAEPEDFRVSIPDQYNLIYRENASRLGCLEPAEALDVVRFYQLVLAVNADISPGGALYEGTTQANSFAENRALLIAALDLSDGLAVKVGLRVHQEG